MSISSCRASLISEVRENCAGELKLHKSSGGDYKVHNTENEKLFEVTCLDFATEDGIWHASQRKRKLLVPNSMHCRVVFPAQSSSTH